MTYRFDVLVIDMDWHPTFRTGEVQKERDQSGEPKGRTEYSWNRLLFPEPAKFLAKLHAAGVKVTLNLHPAGGIEPREDAYPAIAKAMNIARIAKVRPVSNYGQEVRHQLPHATAPPSRTSGCRLQVA